MGKDYQDLKKQIQELPQVNETAALRKELGERFEKALKELEKYRK